jgi:hypothetical protein
MNTSLFKSLILIVGILLAGGCGKKNQQAEIILVDKEFNVSPFEHLSETGGDFQLRLSTIANEDCGGTRIGYEQFANSSQVTVTISELKYPSTCKGNAEPAKDTISFGKLKNGSYKLNIALGKSISNAGTLRVNDAVYQITMNKENGIRMIHNQLLRVPKNAIWGFIGYDKEQEVKFIEFLNNLSKIAAPIDVADGYYGYYTITNREINIHDTFNSGKQTIKKVMYTLFGTHKELQDLVLKSKAVGFDFRMFTSEGKVIN